MNKPKAKLYYSINQMLNYLKSKNDDWRNEFKSYVDEQKKKCEDFGGDLIAFEIKLDENNQLSHGLKQFLKEEFGNNLNFQPHNLYE